MSRSGFRSSPKSNQFILITHPTCPPSFIRIRPQLFQISCTQANKQTGGQTERGEKDNLLQLRWRRVQVWDGGNLTWCFRCRRREKENNPKKAAFWDLLTATNPEPIGSHWCARCVIGLMNQLCSCVRWTLGWLITQWISLGCDVFNHTAEIMDETLQRSLSSDNADFCSRKSQFIKPFMRVWCCFMWRCFCRYNEQLSEFFFFCNCSACP